MEHASIVPVSGLTPIGRAHGPGEAALAVSMLEAAGIAVFALHSHMNSVALDRATALGGIDICVPAQEAEAACEILADFQPFRSRSLGVRLLFLLLFLFPNVPPPDSGFYLLRVPAKSASRESHKA